ncbi:MAG: peptidoglycan editing factor PgeF [Burkholderiaceae bacterium]|nr:peptidoglycan editing factor PgeF [Burkholderiaceae bacterium]
MPMSIHRDWIVPDWPAPPQVRALCTTRAGGVSGGPYARLNLGDHVGDDGVAVARNRELLREAIGVRPVFLQQVHGVECVEFDTFARHGVDAHDGVPDGRCADACTTMAPGLACTVLVADCLPVLLCDRTGRRVAAAHAGWRGLMGGVIETAARAFGRPACELLAWLGPCIGPRAFEVGAQVRALLTAADEGAAACFMPASTPGKYWADLPALARRRLHALGIEAIYGNDGSDDWCTVRQSARFFSHRRDRISGRFAALVWIDA